MTPEIIFTADNVGSKAEPVITDIESEAMTLDTGAHFLHSKLEQEIQRRSVGNLTKFLTLLSFYCLSLIVSGTVFPSFELFRVRVCLNPGKRRTLSRRLIGIIHQCRFFL